MKKQFLFILTGIFLLTGTSLYLSRKYDPSMGNFMLDKNTNSGDLKKSRQNAKDAMQWRFDKLKDENGNLDPSYFQNAVSQADVMRQYGSRSAFNLQWEELGPDNVGGRTRVILIDKRDPTRNTIYAGGVSGGMWKSLDGGNTWARLQNWNQWLSVSCVIQDSNNKIYIGTGEGLSNCCPGVKFESGQIGNGIFTLDNNDNPVPFAFNTVLNNNWMDNTQVGAVINRIAVDPQDPTQIIAATGSGLWQSMDGGGTWSQPTITGVATNLSAADVKWASDGVNVFAAIGGNNRFVMSPDGGQTWKLLTNHTNAGFPGPEGRIEIAISPSNPNYVYLLIANALGCTAGLYSTVNANDFSTGCTWRALATSGPLFDPFTSECQGWYDNTIAVNPFNPTKVYMGGVNFYTWGSLTGAQLADAGLGSSTVNPNYIHPDKHTIVFSDIDSDVMFVGCDGGVYKSTDAATGFPYPTYVVKNRGYNVTQNYSVAAAITGEVMGGSQDNGTNYINYNGNTEMSANEVIGGDGSYTEISHLDPKIFFGGIYYGNYSRSGNYAQSFDGFYDIKIDPAGLSQPSGCELEKDHNAPFISVMYLSETRSAANGIKTVPFIADNTYPAGSIISLQSNTDAIPFQQTLTSPLIPGDTLFANDPIRSRVFISSFCGVWVTPDALNLGGIPRWYLLVAFDAMGSFVTADSYAASNDGNTLYLGTNSGSVYRFDNLNARCDTTTYPPGDVPGVLYPNSNMYLVNDFAPGKDVEGISVDPNNSNHVVAVLAGYSASNAPHVWESVNGGSTWTPDTAGLPNMPVYDVVVHDSTTFIIGTELGIWGWDGSQWTEQNNGTQRVPVFRLIEKELYDGGCQVLYSGTHGRGMWRTTSLTAAGCQLQAGIAPTLGISTVTAANISGLNIFPNPVRKTSQIALTLDQNAGVALRIFDMTGKLCREFPNRNAMKGENIFVLDATGLSSGTYLLSATVADTRTQSRLFTVSQ